MKRPHAPFRCFLDCCALSKHNEVFKRLFRLFNFRRFYQKRLLSFCKCKVHKTLWNLYSEMNLLIWRRKFSTLQGWSHALCQLHHFYRQSRHHTVQTRTQYWSTDCENIHCRIYLILLCHSSAPKSVWDHPPLRKNLVAMKIFTRLLIYINLSFLSYEFALLQSRTWRQTWL